MSPTILNKLKVWLKSIAIDRDKVRVCEEQKPSQDVDNTCYLLLNHFHCIWVLFTQSKTKEEEEENNADSFIALGFSR